MFSRRVLFRNEILPSIPAKRYSRSEIATEFSIGTNQRPPGRAGEQISDGEPNTAEER
jgi:hypothetical protein